MGGSEPILTLFKFRNLYGKMDRPLSFSSGGVGQSTKISGHVFAAHNSHVFPAHSERINDNFLRLWPVPVVLIGESSCLEMQETMRGCHAVSGC